MLEKKSILSTLFAAFKVIFVVFVFSRMYVPILIIVYQSFNASANSSTAAGPGYKPMCFFEAAK